MPKQSAPRPKHTPQRTCVACRKVEGKRAMIRLVRTAQGIEIDPTGKKSGRGMYLHPNRACWQSVLAGNRIDQALRMKLSPEDRQALLTYMQTLPADDENSEDR